jgi:hypothetical protein
MEVVVGPQDVRAVGLPHGPSQQLIDEELEVCKVKYLRHTFECMVYVVAEWNLLRMVQDSCGAQRADCNLWCTALWFSSLRGWYVEAVTVSSHIASSSSVPLMVVPRLFFQLGDM